MTNQNSKEIRPLRVGFDLDGVLLYNPARIIRPIVAIFKNIFVKKKRHTFIIPKSPLQQKVWSLLHLSSMFIAPGFQDVKKLIEEGKIEAYIITARYSFLKDDFVKWQKKMNAQKYFKACYSNENDEQPHLFKERMIKELDLDLFIEDNWDIVSHLHNNMSLKNGETDPTKLKPKIFWIYNIMDRNIEHPFKYPYLKKAVKELQKMVHERNTKN